IGFKYTYEVDPFDGGPHYRCPLKEIKPIKEKITGLLVDNRTYDATKAREVIISLDHPEHDFFAIRAAIEVHGDGQISMAPELIEKLGIEVPQKITAIPFS